VDFLDFKSIPKDTLLQDP